MTLRRVDFVVVGRVQGVCYRASTQDKARSLDLVGSVQNLLDGSVRVVAEGEQAVLEELVSWCRQGPSFARVDELTPRFSDALGEFSAFTILR